MKSFVGAGAMLGLPGLAMGVETTVKAVGANSQVRVAVVGLGGIDVVGGVGGRGRQLIGLLQKVPAAKIVALCDVDKTVLEHGVQQFKERGETVAAHTDYRRILDDQTVDAVVLATPNHWHALGTVWGCQAGKDVYVEKPFSYNIWEGRQMVAAARKYGRMVQVGTQRRASSVLPQVFDFLRSGQIGHIRYAHALVFRPRDGIGKVSAPTVVPESVDYDLWCGPAPKGLLTRRQLHYDWHWGWPTGNAELGNNGLHVLDICRWGLGYATPPRRAMSIGGRFGFNDDGETPNTHLTILDYQPAPIICEIRNYRKAGTAIGLGKYRNSDKGIIIECEGGYFAGDFTSGAVYDRQDRKIKDFQDGRKSGEVETALMANFIEAVRTRKQASLNAEAMEGHISAACCHMGNISHRIGKQSTPGAIQEAIRADQTALEAFTRCQEYLRGNGVDLNATPAVLGPWVTFDAQQEQFVNEFADRANELSRREYREPFVVPRI
ncbi:MAG: Gfo/Idh/MocA family oxidoreductase [Verrucomicrobiota bacterium]